MKKEELSKILHELNIPVFEGKVPEKYAGKYPLIHYWVYLEQDTNASDEGYDNLVTYQISFFAHEPKHEKYKELRRVLRNHGIRPIFYHEYLERDPIFSKAWHTYFAIEVTEEINE